MRFLVVYEKGPNNYCAFVPNLPVICMSTGGTVRRNLEQNIREAMEGHIEYTILDGDPLPEPLSWYRGFGNTATGRRIAKGSTGLFSRNPPSTTPLSCLTSLIASGWVIVPTKSGSGIVKALEVYPQRVCPGKGM